MSTPLDKVKALADKGWSVDRVKEIKAILKASEINYLIPFEGYLSDLAPIRFLLHYSDFEEPMVRLLWHRYSEMKLKGNLLEQTLKRAIEFIQLSNDHNYEGISALIEKLILPLSPSLDSLARVIRHNYRVNLWNIISRSFEELSRKELQGIFGVSNLGELKNNGFPMKENGEFVQISQLPSMKQTQKESEVQMRILESAISRIESI